MIKPSVLLATLIAMGLSPQLVQGQTSQPWLEDRRQRAAIGIRAGDLELHPGVAGEVGYDSNYYQSAGSSSDPQVIENVVPSARLRITPSISVNSSRASARNLVAQPPRFDVAGKLVGRFDQIWALGDTNSGESSRTMIDGDLSGTLSILPQRPFGAGISVIASHISQPSDNPAISDSALGRTLVGGSLELRWRPGGGNLEWALGYDARVAVYDNPQLHLNTFDQAIQTRGRWLFLPRTSLLYQAESKFVSYINQGNSGRQVNSTPITALLGVNGLLTSKIGLMLLAGWKSTFFDSTGVSDYDSPVGRAELTWYLSGMGEAGAAMQGTGLSVLRLAYQRDADISGIADYYTLDRVYADLTYTSGSTFTINARAGVSWINQPEPRGVGGDDLTPFADGLDEWRPEVRLYGEYRLTSTLAVFSNNAFTGSPRHNYILINPDQPAGMPRQADTFDDLHFTRLTLLLGARWFM